MAGRGGGGAGQLKHVSAKRSRERDLNALRLDASANFQGLRYLVQQKFQYPSILAVPTMRTCISSGTFCTLLHTC